ncbi:MAG: cytochrome b/b6 domain-containing protein [Caldilineales bacterium]|nr:cytochrome b/b6 domain-containing protein [Caldilineales bacterium]
MSEQPRQEYVRFSLTDRIEHMLLLVSFTVLVITGLPQKYVPAAWAEFVIGLMGGIETVRIIHRVAAVVLILESIFHVITVSYKLFVRRVSPSMLPTLQDFVDFLDALRYNLGLAKRRPQYDRYNFEEKIEYWAVIWGTAVMIITGFMLWNPITTTKFLPGSWIPAAKAAHGGEALLAFLAIIVWHVYNVHIKTFNRSMFTGKLSREEMLHEHPKELERIESGRVRPDPPREVIRRRERVFLPIAGVFAVVSLLLVYFFVTYEETAIATVPTPVERAAVFVPATPTPLTEADMRLALSRGRAQLVPHAISAGRENCLACHGLGTIAPYTTIHANLRLGNETCLGCHRLAPGAAELPGNGATPSFSAEILPILQRRCVACHNRATPLDLTGYRAVMRGDGKGPIVIPGASAQSRLLTLGGLTAEAHPSRFTADEMALIGAWIDAGAPEN